MNNIGLVIFVFTYLILFGLMTWWFCRLEDKWDKQSRGHRSNEVYFDEATFSKHMNPPEESTPTDEEVYNELNRTSRAGSIRKCILGIGSDEDWKVFYEDIKEKGWKPGTDGGDKNGN